MFLDPITTVCGFSRSGERRRQKERKKENFVGKKRERETGEREREITYDALVVTPAHIEDGGWGSKNG